MPAVGLRLADVLDAGVGAGDPEPPHHLGRDPDRDRVARQVGDEAGGRLGPERRQVEVGRACGRLVQDLDGLHRARRGRCAARPRRRRRGTRAGPSRPARADRPPARSSRRRCGGSRSGPSAPARPPPGASAGSGRRRPPGASRRRRRGCAGACARRRGGRSTGSAASTLTSAASDAFSSPRSASSRDGVATNSAWISASVRPVTSVRNESGRTQPPPAPRSA